ncbi:hypothetical protein RchiOBHm_Chr2g0126371 [Rosa chinensis]|uniref:Uncharacterized protein n=1 Tax=Rosa chinensis TaxID=74649 RepID=A0A2P6RTT3_ROSCH|nr:hypothetical protein RchiOBHm_Chr2g0126371 [Rosa chinensis]
MFLGLRKTEPLPFLFSNGPRSLVIGRVRLGCWPRGCGCWPDGCGGDRAGGEAKACLVGGLTLVVKANYGRWDMRRRGRVGLLGSAQAGGLMR